MPTRTWSTSTTTSASIAVPVPGLPGTRRSFRGRPAGRQEDLGRHQCREGEPVARDRREARSAADRRRRGGRSLATDAACRDRRCDTADPSKLKFAIVGSGPSGFYAAEALLKRCLTARVDMFDRLPTPFGLVRGGVAPDHPKLKQVIAVYDKIARTPGFRFVGNVSRRERHGGGPARQLSRGHLRLWCEHRSPPRHSRRGACGSHTATEFVGWYNGHPDYRDCTFDFSAERAVVIGKATSQPTLPASWRCR